MSNIAGINTRGMDLDWVREQMRKDGWTWLFDSGRDILPATRQIEACGSALQQAGLPVESCALQGLPHVLSLEMISGRLICQMTDR